MRIRMSAAIRFLRWFRPGMLLLLSSTALADAPSPEDVLHEAFVGRHVVSRIEMPASNRGLVIDPRRDPPLDPEEASKRLQRLGVAIRPGDRVLITKVEVAKAEIRFELGGGGFGTLDAMALDNPPRSQEELDLERRLEHETHAPTRRELEARLEELRAQRERNRVSGDRWERLQHLKASRGSRFFVRFDADTRDSLLTPRGLFATLAPYLEFPRDEFPDAPMPDSSVATIRDTAARALQAPADEPAVSTGAIGIELDLSIDAELVYFARLDPDSRDPYAQPRVHRSQVTRGPRAYLVEVPPGRYAAVAAYYRTIRKPTDLLTHDPGERLFYFSRALVESTEVSVELGRLAFAGRHRPAVGGKLREADVLQNHYRQLLRKTVLHAEWEPALLKMSSELLAGPGETAKGRMERAEFHDQAGRDLAGTRWAGLFRP